MIIALMPLESGTRLGPYEILTPIGAGGMGEVYKAKDTRLERIVAIKVLPEHLAENPERKQRFEREAKAISKLNHPHICTLYDVGEQNGIDYLVMEYIEGETLADAMKKGALPLDKALEYGAQIADGLGTAHRAGIVHRDLKPGNMMLTKSGIKLLDFGLARFTTNDAVSVSSDAPTRQKDLTKERTILGTLRYMAPEQLEGKTVDARADADIASFFDTLAHEVVMSRVRARIADGRVLDLIEAFLKAGISENNVVTVPTEGTPQGGVISPWLSNLVLDDLDKALESRQWRHVRYADDFVVLCRSREEAQDALTFVTEVLGKLQLSLSETKTKVSDFNEGFEFLGFHFRNYRLGIRDKSIDRFKDRVRTLTQRHQGRNVEAILEDLNPVIRGWANYVGVAQVADLFRGLDSWIRMRIRAFKTKHRNAHDNWRLPSRKLKKWGLLSLQECRPEFCLSYVSCNVPSESKVGSLT